MFRAKKKDQRIKRRRKRQRRFLSFLMLFLTMTSLILKLISLKTYLEDRKRR